MFAALFEQKSAAPKASKGTPASTALAKQKANKKAPVKPSPAPLAPSGGLSKKQAKKKRQREAAAAEQQQKPRKPAPSASAAGGPSSSVAVSRPEAGSALQRSQQQLAGAHFRRINEELYTTHSSEAVALFREQPELFELYHAGFRSQAAHWPQRPVDVLARWLGTKPATWSVADLGCGDAELATLVRQRMHSFDLVANNPRVTACDVAKVPLGSGVLDAAIFCLALMGTNHADFVREAHRLLKPRGALKIVEVSSRFDDLDAWLAMLRSLGFDLLERDASNTHFVVLEFAKSARAPAAAAALREVALKPCIYKRR